MENRWKEIVRRVVRPAVPGAAWCGLVLLGMLAPVPALLAQSEVAAGPPPSSGGIFPLSEVKRGMTGTAWTVFSGTKPEAMQVEILGVLRGARGPGQDMILVQLHGAKPEYTGVVAGMSGSPVYIGNRLVGSLSYRIGEFSKDPIAGITPIEQMLEVRDLPIQGSGVRGQGSVDEGPGAKGLGTKGLGAEGLGNAAARRIDAEGMNFQAMETPLEMSGFRPEVIQLWQKKMAGTGLEMVTAGGMGSSSLAGSNGGAADGSRQGGAPSAALLASVVPGSAVSAQLVRGDLEIAATCTVTYVDARQLLACGHPILGAGPVSLPMTATEVVATLASPLNAFKIVNTGEWIGAFTEDRNAAIRGVLGARARMIPVHIAVHSPAKDRNLNVEVLDLPSLTPSAILVSLYQVLLNSNQNSAETSYHVTGSIGMEGHAPSPIDVWASAGDQAAAPLEAALLTGNRFARIYSNGARLGAVRAVDLEVESIPRRVQVELESAHVVSGDIVHAGDTVVVEATVRPWQQAARNVRIPVKLPTRLGAGNLRLLVSDSGTLDRTLDQPRQPSHPADLETVLADEARKHAADRIYVSLLVPETQAGMEGRTLTGLPLSMANALEPLRAAQDVSLNGESAEVTAEAPAGGVLTGFQVLNVHVEAGGGLN